MTFDELLATSVRIEEEKPVKDFELAVSELIAMYRHRVSKPTVLFALRRQHDLVSEDVGWQEPNGTNPGWIAVGGKGKGKSEDDDEDADEHEKVPMPEKAPEKPVDTPNPTPEQPSAA
jgi:hypothetical protein